MDIKMKYFHSLDLKERKAVEGFLQVLLDSIRHFPPVILPLPPVALQSPPPPPPAALQPPLPPPSVALQSPPVNFPPKRPAKPKIIKQKKSIPRHRKEQPLLIDNTNRYRDVFVNQHKLKEAVKRVASASVRHPARFLLNKILQIVFTPSELANTKGVKGLNLHKQEALKEKQECSDSTEDSMKRKPGEAVTAEGDEDDCNQEYADHGDAPKPQSTSEWLRQLFTKSLSLTDQKPAQVLEDVSFEGVAKYIKSNKCKKIVTMAGAGISTSAGIPDFRSPDTGLYHNLQKFDLPHPQAIFEINFFRKYPKPFFTLAKQLWPGLFKPTPCHYFIMMLHSKDLLMRHYTQNIDTLERVAGLPGDLLVEAHGTFYTSHCIQCHAEYNQDWIKEKIFAEEIPYCEEEECNGLVKPDIVFFGEPLPSRFFDCCQKDLKNCDLLIIMGTSLKVHPFASLPSRVSKTTPRLYINLEKMFSGDLESSLLMLDPAGFLFDSEDNYRDVFWQGTCDDGCYALADALGWGAEFRELVEKDHKRIDEESAQNSSENAATNKL